MDGHTWIALLVACIGYAAKYVNDLRIAERKDQLDRVNAQLRDLYGPLLALIQASDTAYIEFRKKHRHGTQYFVGDPPPTERDLAAWRNWMTHVFMPLNRKMESVILANAHLIEDRLFPPGFHALLAHVAGYKTVMNAWKEQNYAEHQSIVDFPRAVLPTYVKETYEALMAKQHRLLHSLETHRF